MNVALNWRLQANAAPFQYRHNGPIKNTIAPHLLLMPAIRSRIAWLFCPAYSQHSLWSVQTRMNRDRTAIGKSRLFNPKQVRRSTVVSTVDCSS